jgi:hypothetical protein
MKRVILFVLIVAVATGAVFYAVRRTTNGPQTAVASLLPKQTVALVTVPDFNRIRDQWHETDVYKIYQEPAVQDFLRKPLSKVPQKSSASDTLHDFEQLGLKDPFIALASIENDHYSMVAGFRFRGSQSDAEKIINKWRAQAPGLPTKPSSVDYQGCKIDISGEGANLIATAYDRDWFFASNDLEQLKALLDRASHRTPATGKDQSLEQDEDFRTATSHIPGNYAALLYFQPKSLSDKLTALRTQVSGPSSSQQRTMLEQIHSVCGAMRFEGGKIHDWWFVGMQEQEQGRKLTRSAASLGTADTFFYLASVLNIERLSNLSVLSSVGPGAAWFQKAFAAGARQGLTADDWKAAFDLELSSLADWPTGGRWPTLIATLPVKDFARADKVVTAFTSAIDEDAGWTKTEKDGVRYFSAPWPFGNFISLNPTIAFSKERLVAGLDPAAVEETIGPGGQGSSVFSGGSSYRAAAQALPDPTNLFGYIDLPLLYSRLDSALRPMLLMTAAFMPGISDRVDVTKLPPPEVVTKHLSPIVISQRYERDGYLSESVGPITFSQAALTIGLPAALWFGAHRR